MKIKVREYFDVYGYFLFDWDDIGTEILGCDGEFEQRFVICGNNDFNMMKRASWFVRLQNILFDLDMGEIEDKDLSEEQKEALTKIYEDNYSIGTDEMVEMLNIIYPTKSFDYTEMHGCVQREWMDIIYEEKDRIYVDDISDFFFGYVSSVELEDEGFILVPHNKMWNIDYHEFFGIPKDEEIEIEELP